MYAAFALLANAEVDNLVRKLGWEMHQKYRTGTKHCRLPPHVSLKQPFRVPSADAAETYMDELAQSINPFEVHLTEIQIDSLTHAGTEYGILWLSVEASEGLRQLHIRVNQEMDQRFGNTQADFDGTDYQFHMTAMIGGQPVEVYRQFLDELNNRAINLRYTAHELSMFVYDEPRGPDGEYMCYRTLPIGK